MDITALFVKKRGKMLWDLYEVEYFSSVVRVNICIANFRNPEQAVFYKRPKYITRSRRKIQETF